MPISLREIIGWLTFRRRAEPDHQLPGEARTAPEHTTRADEQKSTYALAEHKPFALLSYLGRFVPGWLKKSVPPLLPVPAKNVVLPVADKLKARASWKGYTDANDVITAITLLEARILTEPADQSDRPFIILQLATAPDIVGPPLTRPTLRTETHIKKYFGWFLDGKIAEEEMVTLIRLSMEFSQVGWHIIHGLLVDGLQSEDGTHRNQTRIIMVKLGIAENCNPIKRLYNRDDIPIVTKLGILLALLQLGFKEEDGGLSYYKEVDVCKTVDIVDTVGGGGSMTDSQWTRESQRQDHLPVDVISLGNGITADIAEAKPGLATGIELMVFLKDFIIPPAELLKIIIALLDKMHTSEDPQIQTWAHDCALLAIIRLYEQTLGSRDLKEQLSRQWDNLVKEAGDKTKELMDLAKLILLYPSHFHSAKIPIFIPENVAESVFGISRLMMYIYRKGLLSDWESKSLPTETRKTIAAALGDTDIRVAAAFYQLMMTRKVVDYPESREAWENERPLALRVYDVTVKSYPTPHPDERDQWFIEAGLALMQIQTNDQEVIEDINHHLKESPALVDDLFRKKVALWQIKNIGISEAMQTYKPFFERIDDKKLRETYLRLPLVFSPGNEHLHDDAVKIFLLQFVFIEAQFDELLFAALAKMTMGLRWGASWAYPVFLNQNTKLRGFEEHYRYLRLIEAFPFRITVQTGPEFAGDDRDLIAKILGRLRTMREAPLIPLTKEEQAHRDKLRGEPMERLRTRIAEVELTLHKKRPGTGQLSLVPVSGQLSLAPDQPGMGDLSLMDDSPCITGGEILVGSAATTEDTPNGDADSTEDDSKDQPSDEPLATSDTALADPLTVEVPVMGVVRGPAARILVIKK